MVQSISSQIEFLDIITADEQSVKETGEVGNNEDPEDGDGGGAEWEAREGEKIEKRIKWYNDIEI